MSLLERIGDMLGYSNALAISQNREEITEIHLRVARPVRYTLRNGKEIVTDCLEKHVFHKMLNTLMDNSLYSCENELKSGYFTTSEGFRVGVCGKVNAGKSGIENLANIGSACIRIPREIRGAAAELYSRVSETKRYSTLILSPPGFGKTTLLRDYVRMLSDGGLNVGLVDERREIACCLDGIPQMDVGSRTDVLDGCPKAVGLNMLIRSCAPNLVAADEIGDLADAQAILEARRCGVAIVTTAHAWDLEDAFKRVGIQRLLVQGVFDWCVLFGSQRGQVRQIRSLHEVVDEKVDHVQRDSVGADIARLHLHGANAIQCAAT